MSVCEMHTPDSGDCVTGGSNVESVKTSTLGGLMEAG